MRILIIGANGFIGQAAARSARLLGHKVFCLGRSAHPNDADYLRGDRSNAKAIGALVNAHGIQVVIDMIPMVLADTTPLLSTLDDNIRQYIMISSCDVYANYELLQRRANGSPQLGALDESSPLRKSRYPYREEQARTHDDTHKYLDDYDKIPIEAAVQTLSCAWTILRLPMVYGPGDRQKRFRWAIAPMQKGQDVLSMPSAWANWQSTYGYVDNVGAAIAKSVGHEPAYKQIYNVAEANPVPQLEWAHRCAEILDWRGEIVQSDDLADSFSKQVSHLDLSIPLTIDGSRLRADLDFSDVIDTKTALELTIASEADAGI